MQRLLKVAGIGIFLMMVLLIFPGSGVMAKTGTVNIGVIYPLSGAAGFVGQDALRGIELAVEQINSQGGITVKGKKYLFEIRSYDDEATPAKSVIGLRKLKDRYDIPVVVMMFSGPSLAVIENNVDLNILWTGMAMHPDITNSGNPLVIRHNCPITDTAKRVAKRLADFGYKQVAHLCSIDDWGRGWDQNVTKVFETGGGKTIAHEWLDERTDVDFRAQLTKIKGLNADALFIAAHDEVAAMITRQARELGLQIPLIHSEGFQQKGWELVGPKNMDGCYYTNNSGLPLTVADYPKNWPFTPEAKAYMEKHPNIARKTYAKAFDEKYPDKTMAAYGFVSYENQWVVNLAMEKAQTVTDPKAIRKAMYEVLPLKPELMTFGVKGYTENGDGIMTPELMEFREGIWRFPTKN